MTWELGCICDKGKAINYQIHNVNKPQPGLANSKYPNQGKIPIHIYSIHM